ncbi:MAG: hypothetical protein AB1505_31095 [Candidatus Latescibacterota bacterium]
MRLTLCCAETNDLYRVLAAAGARPARCATLGEALGSAPEGSAVLSLADAYPAPGPPVDAEALRRAGARGLRLYLEYPAAVAGVPLGEPAATQWERAVVASDFYAPDLEALTILALHGCYYLQAEARAPHLVVARVAGYHRAVYGLPPSSRPLLFALPGGDGLLATTKLSQFVTGRYGPQWAWKALWERLLAWLCPGERVPELEWTPSVGLSLERDAALPADAEATAVRRAVRWFRQEVLYSIDWKKGAIEGFESGIDHRGRQLRRTWVRGDCTGEAAMVFAWDWALHRDPESRHRAGQILDYVLSAPDFYHDDPQDPAWGLNNWYERGPVFYGDDNARVLLGALTAARLTGGERWDERLLRCVLANLRTTGQLGFRRARIDHHQFAELGGWPFFYAENSVHYAPHYQAYLWAVYLWVHALTEDPELLEKPRRALRLTMDAYPDQWRWTNGLTQEMARLLLPLAFLVRVDDTAEHREWLERMAAEVLARMEPCGAIAEELGAPGQGSYGPPASNEAYGTSEATLMQEPGDPACDLLYTTNYAFLGLHEAARATGWTHLQEAADRLAGFLCRIQVRSQDHPELDGAWMRSFDYELWEYWGSSADLGWGAWSVESGWTNTWIASTLAMRLVGESLFDLSLAGRLRGLWPALRREMFALPAASPAPAAGGLPGSVPGSEQAAGAA